MKNSLRQQDRKTLQIRYIRKNGEYLKIVNRFSAIIQIVFTLNYKIFKTLSPNPLNSRHCFLQLLHRSCIRQPDPSRCIKRTARSSSNVPLLQPA